MKTEILVLLATIILLASCAPQATKTPTMAALTLEETANKVMNALADKDMRALAEFVHPERGVRFSPYAFVRDEHQVFMARELDALLQSDEVYNWGNYDGSGQPIELTFSDYYDEFVYSTDFVNAEQGDLNQRIG